MLLTVAPALPLALNACPCQRESSLSLSPFARESTLFTPAHVQPLLSTFPLHTPCFAPAHVQVLLAMSQTASARGKMVQQGGFKALISLVLSSDKATEAAAAWALAKATLYSTLCALYFIL